MPKVRAERRGSPIGRSSRRALTLTASALPRVFSLALLLIAAASPSVALAQPEGVGNEVQDVLRIRLAYVGFGYVESSEEDCPRMRPNGTEVLTAELSFVGSDFDEHSSEVEYEGEGWFRVDIDGCGLTPNREDPGMVHDRGDVLGDFHGDNFLGCMLSTVVPQHEVRVRVTVYMEDGDEPDQPNSVGIEWEPIETPVAVDVKTECESAFHAQYVADITSMYQEGGGHGITNYDLLQQMVAPGGTFRQGTYRDSDWEGWTYTVEEAIEIPSLVDDE
jgi:hypothetical protein